MVSEKQNYETKLESGYVNHYGVSVKPNEVVSRKSQESSQERKICIVQGLSPPIVRSIQKWEWPFLH